MEKHQMFAHKEKKDDGRKEKEKGRKPINYEGKNR